MCVQAGAGEQTLLVREPKAHSGGINFKCESAMSGSFLTYGVRRFREQKDIKLECEGPSSARPQGMRVLETKEDLQISQTC